MRAARQILLGRCAKATWPNLKAYIRCTQENGNAPYWRLPIAFDMRSQTLELKFRVQTMQNRIFFISSHDGQILGTYMEQWPSKYFRYFEPAGTTDVRSPVISGVPVTVSLGPEGYVVDDTVLASPAASYANPSATANNTMVFAQNGAYRSSGDIYHVTVKDSNGNFLLACYPRIVDGVACLWDAVADKARGFSIGSGGSTANVTYGEDD